MEKMNKPEHALAKLAEFAHRGGELVKIAASSERAYFSWLKPGAHTGEENISIEQFASQHEKVCQYPNEYYIPIKNPEDIMFAVQDAQEKTAFVRKKHPNERVEHIQFASAYEENTYPENNTAHGYLVKKPGNKTGALFIGGWRRGTKKPEMELCSELAEKGIDTLIQILPYHDERMPKQSAWNGEFFISSDLYWTAYNVRQAVSEARTLIHWLREKGYERTGIVGYSYGSVLSTLAFNAEPELDFMVGGALAVNLSGMIWHNRLTRPLKMRLLELGITQKDLQTAWKHTDPKDIALTLDLKKVLMISTAYDTVLLPKYQDTAWKALRQPKRLRLPTNHMAPLLPPWRERFVSETASFIPTPLNTLQQAAGLP